jgi:hypothetical protein
VNAKSLSSPERPHIALATVAAFLAILVVDFITHAVLLSNWWRTTATFWRTLDELFRLIPYAYLSFLLYAAGLTRLLVFLKGPRPRIAVAIKLGAAAGAFIGVTNILAVYSVLPLPRSALLVFPLSFISDLAAAGASAALVLTANRPWRRLALLALAFFLLLLLGLVLQNLLSSARVPR